jgi:hypothetical protein
MGNIPFRTCSIVQILHVVNYSCLTFCIFHCVLAFSHDIIDLGHYYGTFVVFVGCKVESLQWGHSRNKGPRARW